MGAYKEPHGGKLQELYLTESAAEQEKLAARDYPSWNLTDRQLCDLELLLNGGFSPLDGFLGRADYESVLSSMRLANKLVWPIPINLDVSEEFAANLQRRPLALRDRRRADRDNADQRSLAADKTHEAQRLWHR